MVFYIYKKFKLILFFFSFLWMSQTFSSECILEKTQDSKETGLKKASFPFLEIPSKAQKVGIKAPGFIHAEIEKSWSYVSTFTHQTFKNFSKGLTKGMLYVHSYEDIMGAIPCFIKMWNQKHLQDQIPEELEDFHQNVSSDQYINNYLKYVLSQRVLISGSVLAFSKDNVSKLCSTFSPINLIFDVPKECIVVTSRTDARTPVDYVALANDLSSVKEKIQNYVNKQTLSMETLDALMRYPSLQKGTKGYFNEMNEVAILGCALKDEEQFRPRAVGVLINKSAPLPGFDYGNAIRNQEWEGAARKFAKQHGLPCLEIDNSNIFFHEEDLTPLIQEWFEGTTKSLSSYYMERDSFVAEEDRLKVDNLRKLVDKKIESKKASSDCPLKKKREMYREAGEEVVKEQPDLYTSKHVEIMLYGSCYTQKSKHFLMSLDQLEAYGLKRK